MHYAEATWMFGPKARFFAYFMRDTGKKFPRKSTMSWQIPCIVLVVKGSINLTLKNSKATWRIVRCNMICTKTWSCDSCPPRWYIYHCNNIGRRVFFFVNLNTPKFSHFDGMAKQEKDGGGIRNGDFLEKIRSQNEQNW